MYDILAGKANMESSYVLGRGKALEAFPMLKGDGLCGAVVYYDGKQSFGAGVAAQCELTQPMLQQVNTTILV